MYTYRRPVVIESDHNRWNQLSTTVPCSAETVTEDAVDVAEVRCVSEIQAMKDNVLGGYSIESTLESRVG